METEPEKINAWLKKCVEKAEKTARDRFSIAGCFLGSENVYAGGETDIAYIFERKCVFGGSSCDKFIIGPTEDFFYLYEAQYMDGTYIGDCRYCNVPLIFMGKELKD